MDKTIQTINRDWYCIHCGYNLRTLSVAGLCPECGHPVNDSLQTDMELKWLHRVHRGFTCLLLYWSLGIVIQAAYLLAELFDSFRFAWSGYTHWFRLLLNILGCLGVYHVISSSRYSVIATKYRRSRKFIRIVVLIGLYSSLVFTTIVSSDHAIALNSRKSQGVLLFWALAIFAWVIGFACLAFYANTLLRKWDNSLSLIAFIWVILLAIMLGLHEYGVFREYVSQIVRQRTSATPLYTCTSWMAVKLLGHPMIVLWDMFCAMVGVVFFQRCRTILNPIIVNWRTSID